MKTISKISTLLTIGTSVGVGLAANAAVELENPLNSNTVEGILTQIIGWLTGLVGLLAMASLIYAGLRMVTAFGNEDQVKEAKKIMFWSVVGIIVVALAYVVVKTVGQTLGVAQ